MAEEWPKVAWYCRDCGLITNRPDVQEGYQEYAEKPWTALWCPECADPLREIVAVLKG